LRKLPVSPADFRGVFPVPPLCRTPAGRIDFDETEKILRHIAAGGIRNFIFGGNAFLYHLTLAEHEALADWISGLPGDWLVIPSAGPSYGRAMDQAPILRRHGFPMVMMLPCADPRDARGLERGYREFADAAGTPLLVYLKEESNFGADREAGLDAVARLVRDGICAGIKYAVVRADPNRDAYLDGLLKRVDRACVLSGMGERPAVAHMRDWRLPGFTTGSGCLAPALSLALFDACAAGEFDAAEDLRGRFLPLEDIRDALGPARVLHAAEELAGIASTGPIPPFVSALDEAELNRLASVARELACGSVRVANSPV
jgi:dihydrodipicolinate synthase/N-acetylneuraminate lyase